MDNKDIEYFRQELNQQLDSILTQGQETLDTMSEKSEFFADPADRATAESDRAFILRLRGRGRKVVKESRGVRFLLYFQNLYSSLIQTCMVRVKS